MKKITLFLSILFCSGLAYGQQDSTTDIVLEDRNEIQLNGLFLILGAFELDYEYFLNEESGIGVDVLIAFDNIDIDVNYYISPYYRLYFSKKPAAGFFIEGFGMLNSVEDFVFDSTFDSDGFFTFDNSRFENVTDFALGIGTGVKFVTSRGFVAELNLGIGRNLFQRNRDFTIIGKGGISLGYRF